MILSNDLLIEIGVEELPQTSLKNISESFCSNLVKKLDVCNLKHGNYECFASPRRIATIIKSVATTQPDMQIVRNGPNLKMALNENGELSQTGLGFLKSCEAAIDDLKIGSKSDKSYVHKFQIKECKELIKDTDKFIFVEKLVHGKQIAGLFPNIIKKVVKNVHLPRSMRWGINGTDNFIRPIHWLLVLHGKNVIECELFGIKSSNKTFGHRFLCPGYIEIKSTQEYADALKKIGFVIPKLNERKLIIKNQVENIAKNLGIPLLDEDLLEEIAGLVEWPTAILGEFPKEFLDLPIELLSLVIKKQQKCIPISISKSNDKNVSASLSNKFIIISNICAKDVASTAIIEKNVASGFERVMVARITDAAFFYKKDKAVSFDEMMQQLKKLSFYGPLGSIYDKTVRLETIASSIAVQLREHVNPEFAKNVSVENLKAAAKFCKCDLVSSVVFEFPELQGTMCADYYRLTKLANADIIATAIAEQYLPRSINDDLPKSIEGSILAISDKIDSIVGLFALNKAPTGESDPFGLRRACIGILRILLERNLDIDFIELIKSSIAAFKNTCIIFKAKDAECEKKIIDDVFKFFLERFKNFLIEGGYAHDVIESVLSLISIVNRPIDIMRRIDALKKADKRNLYILSQICKRVKNLVRSDSDYSIAANSLSHADIETNLFQHPSEQALYEEILNKEKAIASLIAKYDYEKIIILLHEMKTSVNRFFEDVMVIVGNPSIKKNRLNLMQRLGHLLTNVANFSEFIF